MIPLPERFKENMIEMLGPEAPAFFEQLEAPAALALRVNPAKDGAADAARAFITDPVPWAEHGFYIDTATRPGAGIAHAAGAFYMQEASAMVSAAALNAQSGERILDLCAAPGGKSTQIAAALGDSGLLVCNEPEPSRAKVLAGNLERLGIRCAVAVNAYPDALASRWPGYFDAVLCDAPCSGEGMFRRDPQSRTQWKEGSPAGCASRQADILDRAADLVRPGGRLVYSTCTFNREENEGSVEGFLERHPDFSPEDFELEGIGASENGMLRVWPHRVRGDGHFCAKLRKDGSGQKADAPTFKNTKDDIALLQALEKDCAALPDVLKKRLVRFGDRMFAMPAECPELKGLHVALPGVALLRAERNRVEPEHALAMVLAPADAHRIAELTDAQAAAYLAGEAVPFDGEKGWTLAVWMGLPLGWGKVSDGYLKNKLPKGLRLKINL